MKCFDHNERDAVGTCKSCGKGLCRDCAVDLDKGLACRDRCEMDVSQIISLIDQNIQHSPISKNIMANLKVNTYAQALFFLLAGVALFMTGLTMGKATELPGMLGIALISYACFAFWRGMRLPNQ